MKIVTILLISLMAAVSSAVLASNNHQLKNVKIELLKNERITMVLASNKAGGGQAQETYLNGVFKLAEKNSLRPLHIFPVTRVLAGNQTPQAFALYAWKNASSSHLVRNHPDYINTLKPLQIDGWNELSAADVDLQQATSYQLDATKTYTIAEVWLKDTDKYDAYYRGTAALREKMGAKVIFKLTPDEYTSLNKGQRVPNFVIMIEWKNKQGPEQYTQSPEFEINATFINEALERINWYEVAIKPGDNSASY